MGCVTTVEAWADHGITAEAVRVNATTRTLSPSCAVSWATRLSCARRRRAEAEATEETMAALR
jgi:hypothetical protein